MKQFFALCLVTFAAAPAFALDAEAERYVRLALQLGEYDPDYVDAYLGPEEWAQSAKEDLKSEAELSVEIAALFADLRAMSPDDPDSINRHRALLKNVQAMDTRMRMVNGETFTFAEEARLIYDVVLPEFDFTEFDRAREVIDKLLPGEGDVSDRIAAFRDSLVIREEARDEVLNMAINECRRRSAQHISLPSSERFTLEYVTDRSWSGYNWYQGDNESLMQFNLDFPIKVSAAIGLGCHEGYPGHHVWNVLVENRLLNEKGWIEFYVFPLFSPGALIGEGSANYGVDLAFPGSEKTDYERNVLFPMAGVDPDKVATLDVLNKLTKKLSFAQMATAQLYLDGAISREEAIEMRRKYGLSSRARAEQSVRFIEQYRSYVLNYSLGQDIVKAYIEKHGDDPASRWKVFEQMLTELHFASDMTGENDNSYIMNFDLALTRAEVEGVYGSIQLQGIHLKSEKPFHGSDLGEFEYFFTVSDEGAGKAKLLIEFYQFETRHRKTLVSEMVSEVEFVLGVPAQFESSNESIAVDLAFSIDRR